MRTIVSAVVGLLVAYLVLVWAVDSFGVLSETICNADFTLPDIACRVVGGAIPFLLVPVCGVAAFFGARRIFAK